MSPVGFEGTTFDAGISEVCVSWGFIRIPQYLSDYKVSGVRIESCISLVRFLRC